MVQWLRFCISTARVKSLIPSWETKIPDAPWSGNNNKKKPLERCSLSHSGSPRVLHLVCMTVASLTLVIMCISILLSRCQTLERRSQCHVHFTRILHKVGVWQMVDRYSCTGFKTKCMSVPQLCLILCNSMDCSPPGSSVHGIPQARLLEWVAISFSNA